MKTILVPTDYSEAAENALQYAIDLAKFSKAKLVLLHAYQIPIPTGQVPVMLISPQELEQENFKKIKTIEKEVLKKYENKIQVESVVRTGFVVDEILDVIAEKKIDLVVMGIRGSGKIGEVLIGSNTTSLMKKTNTPVLAIPDKVKFKKVEKIAFAYDYNGGLNENLEKEIKKFINLFNANVFVLDVIKPDEMPTHANAIAGISIAKVLRGIKHSLYFPDGEDIPSEINTFVDTYKADWLIMIPHKHKLLSDLFHESNTKKMAFHTHVPLLALRD